MHTRTSTPPNPSHVAGTIKGEELSLNKGKEPGRSDRRKFYRSSRDATGINADLRKPILASMPDIPPA